MTANPSESPQFLAARRRKRQQASVPASSAGGQYVILIGAFSKPANVKQLQTKIGELGIRVYTEPLDSPEGKKTRVRAGPFPNREAADKALDKLKRIGVNGVVTARQ
ncbi:MAG: SPOR domain-containing protein [Propionivibrio sp.]|nr:SPOR domain-containing protein [Propionivibrio sp.]